ncbi:hypothetical protein Q8F55_008469 [Vanrija albida]|uniref:FAD-binding PCMH-type domain-containing protein n=1 Tax=Vanrija albida TaxID=181172 RepID=A0ABR3PQX3_9TREE
MRATTHRSFGASATLVLLTLVLSANALVVNLLPGFPAGQSAQPQQFENWSTEINTNVFQTTPKTVDELVAAVNWAAAKGWRVRPRGHTHGWAPTALDNSVNMLSRVLVVDMKSLNKVCAHPEDRSIELDAGASVDSMHDALKAAGLALGSAPALGDITIGGALAIGAHGTGVLASGEERAPGTTLASLSNLVIELDAVVWDGKCYAVKTFKRTDPEIGPFLCHLGRALITRVVLRAGESYDMRVESITNISMDELSAAPGTQGKTVESLLNSAGRMEIIQFPLTPNPWLKVWSLAPTKPESSRAVDGPYNYPFSDSINKSMSATINLGNTLAPGGIVVSAPIVWDSVIKGLAATHSADIWGQAGDVLRYVRESTLRVTANGIVVHCKRADVQKVIHEFHVKHQKLTKEYAAKLLFPINGPLEIRVTDVDCPGDVGIEGAVMPNLTPSRPYDDHPEWDAVVWFDVLTTPTTPFAPWYMKDIEQWALKNYAPYAGVRSEWSKGWAYTVWGGWKDTEIIKNVIPKSYGPHWKAAVETFKKYDPKRLYTSALLDAMGL